MADGIGSMSRSMLGIVGPDGTKNELSWKTTKGKRSRKSVTRTGLSMLSSETPKRVGEFSGSDSDKIDEPSSLADGLGYMPIKKRRHLQSPSGNIEQLPLPPPQHGTPSLHSDKQRLVDVLPEKNNSDDTVNLSGIALLATAACFNSIIDDDDAVNSSDEASLTLRRKCNDTFTVGDEPIQVEGRSNPGHNKCSLDHTLAENNQATQESIFDSPKVNRCYWDLNKLAEEWEVPQEDLVDRKNSVGEASMEVRCSAQSDSVNNAPPVDVAIASFKSKVGGYYTHEAAVNQVDDNKHVGPTLLKNYEHRTSLPEIVGLEMPSNNNSQMKDAEEEDDSQKTSEDKNISAEDLVGKTCKAMDVGILLKCKDMSTSEIYIADHSDVCGGGDDMAQEEKAIATDAMGTNDDVPDHQDHLVSNGVVVKTSISQDSVKTLLDDDDHGLSDATQNISELQVDYDSPYEDGELRVPALYPCGRKELLDEKENECVDFEYDGGEESDPGDYPGSEVVEDGSEGSQAPEKKYSVASEISETVTSKKEVMEENTVVKFEPEGKRHSNQGSGTTDELPIAPLVQDNNDDSMRRERNSRGESYSREVGGLTREKSQYCVEEGSSPFNVSNMSSKHGDSFSRSERGRGAADRSVTRRGSSYSGHRQIGGYNNKNSHWNYRDSTNNRYQGRGPEDHWQQTRIRNAAADSINKFEDVNSYEHDHQPSKFSSKGIQRPFFRRKSPVERGEYYGDHRRFNPTSSGYNKRGGFGKFSGGGFGRGRREEEYVDDDDAVGGYLSRGERSFSPSNRASNVSVPSWKSRSRSPHTWQSQRERNLNTRRRSRSRSPEFRPESSSIERARGGQVPFQKRNFNADNTERFIPSPPKARFSPTRNNRWVNNDNKNFANTLKHHRKSPPPPPVVGVFRQSQRFGRHSGRDNNKSEDNCNDRKHDQRFGLVDHNVRHSGTSNILRRQPRPRPRHDDNDTHVNCEEDDDNSNNNEGKDMPNFGADYEERFLSPPQDNNNRYPGMVSRAQKPKQDDYFRSVTRPGRFTLDGWGNNGRKRNLE